MSAAGGSEVERRGEAPEGTREVLLAEREGLVKRISELEDQIGESLTEVADEVQFDEEGSGGGATSMAVDQMRVLLGTAQERKVVVESLLERLDAGTYGLCITCGNQIPLERLEALPTAQECVSCKSKR